MNKPKKIPMRRCVASNEQYPKKEMFRIVRTPEGNIIIDEIGKANGHGAYLCKKKEVIELARKKKILDKYLEIGVPDSIYDELIARIGDNIDK